MRRISIYGIITIISLLVRQFVLPNPFECFGDNSVLINWIAEPIIQVVAYGIVGIFYISGSAPALGSLLFLLIYALIVGLLWVLGIFSFAWWWIAIVITGLIAILFGIRYLINLLDTPPRF